METRKMVSKNEDNLTATELAVRLKEGQISNELFNEKMDLHLKQQLEYLNKIDKKLTFCKIAGFIGIILLAIILLYQFVTVVVQKRYKPVYYSASVIAEEIVVDKDALDTMTTEEILAESKEMGYISNCREFYLSGDEYSKFKDGSTKYYSVSSLRDAIQGQPLTYKVLSVEKTDKTSPCVTQVANRTFKYGFRDGSSQMAEEGASTAVFSGYSEELLDRYLNGLEPFEITANAVPVVLNGRYEVDEEFINAMLSGVFEDSYMANSEMKQVEEVDLNDSYYGLKVKDGRIYYVKSHDLSLDAKATQEIVEVDITDKIQKNLSEYLGKNVKISTELPFLFKSKQTVINLSTRSYSYNNFYIAAAQELY